MNDKTMKKLHTGFFVIGKDKLSSVVNKNCEKVNPEYFDYCENPYDDASVFLHGSCQLFALALQEKYCYSALNLQTQCNTDAHFFCEANYRGKKVYIDVRGITEELKDIISEFISGDCNYVIVPYSFEREINLSEADKHGLEFAKEIIEERLDVYDINKLDL